MRGSPAPPLARRRSSALAAAAIVGAAGCQILAGIDDRVVGENDAVRRDDAGPTPEGPRDAAPPTILPDGGLQCGEDRLMLCGETCVDLTAEAAHCGTCGNGCPRERVCRGSTCVPPGSCRELRARWPEAASGVHDLTVGGEIVPAYCDMSAEDAGSTLVFRVSAGQRGDPYALFVGGPVNDELREEATPLATQKHYVSRLLARWNVDFPVEKALVRLFVGTNMVREIAFDATGSSRASWFALGTVTASPWTDLAKATVFGVAGHEALLRRFLIHKPYNTCETDEGWLVAHGSGPTFCGYENPATTIRLYYAPHATAQRWSVRVPVADSLAIFAR